jgi:exopolyphosphatase/guanosine-5'-triphosphate,3'-diphosphate pyrophosphatase
MGDLGGGSLEVVALTDGGLGKAATLPLGPLRLIDGGGDRVAMSKVIDDALARLDWLDQAAGRDFLPVGGAWRVLARIHMEQAGYPVHVIHGYSLPCVEAESLARVIAGLGPRSLARLPGVPRRRLDTVPIAALLLERLIRRVRPKRVTFSAFGLREGRLFAQLSPAERREDPLIAAAADLAAHDSRFGDMAPALVAWSEPLFRDEGAARSRLRVAACHLSDIAWRDHPDHRAAHTLARILRLPLPGAIHRDRAFLAYTVFVRYGGESESADSTFARALLRPKRTGRAEVLGRALRLAYALSGGTEEVLASSALRLEGRELTLALRRDGSVPVGEAVERRFGALAEALAVTASRIEA